MNHDGGATLQYGSRLVRISNVQGAYIARKLSPTQRIPQRAHDGARLTMPIARLISVIGTGSGIIDGDLVRDMEKVRLECVAAGASTAVTIRYHDLMSGMEDHHTGRGGTRDPVLAHLLATHGIHRIVRSSPGVDLFWGGLEMRQTSFGNNGPYHRLRGLPPSMPAFMVRERWDSARPCTAVSFGEAATYCCEDGHAWIGIAAELPLSVTARLPGRPVTDLVGHASLKGWFIAEPFDHDPDHPPNAFTLEWRP